MALEQLFPLLRKPDNDEVERRPRGRAVGRKRERWWEERDRKEEEEREMRRRERGREKEAHKVRKRP